MVRRKARTRKQKGGQGLRVTFAGRNANGTRRTRANTFSAPSVSFRGKGLYTIVMWDPDAPSAESWLHWLVTNIPDGAVSRGETVMPYAPPTPPSGEHRYFVSVYAQPSRISVNPPTERGNFDVQAFVDTHGLILLGEKMVKVRAGV